MSNLVEFGSGRTLWVHDDEVVYRKEDNDPKPSKRRNTSKAEDGLKRRLATYDRKVAAINQIIRGGRNSTKSVNITRSAPVPCPASPFAKSK